MLLELAEHDSASVSEMFHTLFNEDQDLDDRLRFFENKAEEIKDSTNFEKEWSTYQGDRALSVYLSLRFPAKYYLYKNEMFNTFCEITGWRDKPGRSKKNDYDVLHQYFQMCDEVRDVLLQDKELIAIHEERLPENITFNDDYHLLTQDFIYCVTTYLKKGEEIDKDEKWYQLARVVQDISNQAEVNKFFDLVAEVIQAYDLESDNKITYAAAFEKEKRMHLTLGGHYIVYLDRKGSNLLMGLYCDINDYEKLKAEYQNALKLNKREIKGDHVAVWMEIDPSNIKVDSIKESVIKAAQTELKGQTSSHRSNNSRHHNKWIFKAALDKGVRNILFNEDFRGYKPVVDSTEEIMPTPKNLNLILYGPPGTGKTYNTINQTIAICNPSFDLSQERAIIKKEYDRLIESGQVCFTTFHQSMSYEDFIEGLKPLEPAEEGGPVIYKVEDGLFKQLCTHAAFSIGKNAASQETAKALDFAQTYDRFITFIHEELSKGNYELKTKTGGSIYVESVSDKNNLILTHKEGSRTYTVSKNRLMRLNAAIDNLEEVSNINDHFRSIIGGSNTTAYWAVLHAILSSEFTATSSEEREFDYEEKKEVVKKMTGEDFKRSSGDPFVLVIDEINRGNVSQIFGELITLIEEDKRAGRQEALEVTLPYSKERFSVPSNLYIIGTMNTADRSVEALDVALRRRFKFDYKGPDYSLEALDHKIENTDYTLADLLRKVNERISFLKDEDHQIGHSYLMDRNSLPALEETFYKNIIPLLKEYFYNDYGKIRMILGDGFVKKLENHRPEFAADDEEVLDATVYRIRSKKEIDISTAIQGIFKKA